MKYILYIILGFVIIVSGCSNNKDRDKPENLIPRDNMVKVLADIQLIEASIKLNNNRKLKKEEYTYYYYQYLFEKHNITEEEFNISLEYYQAHIYTLDTIYIDVISELTKLQGEKHEQ